MTALIIAGFIVGPFGFNLLEVDASVEFLGSIGVVFLMFIAGSSVKAKTLKNVGSDSILLAVLNGGIPFFVGALIGIIFSGDLLTALIMGTIFISSSVAVIIPTLESSKLIGTKLGKTIISATVFEDIVSLLLLAFIFQEVSGNNDFPLPIYIFVFLGVVLLLRFLVPFAHAWFHKQRKGKDLFEGELRFIVVVLLAVAIIFELLGIHAIVAGFIIGMLLSDVLSKEEINQKIRTISYGIFIPIFFLVIGVKTDLSIFSSLVSVTLIVVVVLGLVISKTLSGYLAGKVMRYSGRESLIMGIASLPQLSTTLAVAFAASEINLLDKDFTTSLVILSIITTFIAPLIIKLVSSKFSVEKYVEHEQTEPT